MEIILIKVTQFILSLMVIVLIHEFGHFITAKMFGARVEKFYLFFNPWFSLFKKKVGDTEYGIGWLPMGGFVKISGMVDESMDTKNLKKTPQSYEFRSKKWWQKSIILIAGIFFNLILAIGIYTSINYWIGSERILNYSIQNGLEFSEGFEKIGFKDGDKIVMVDLDSIKYVDEIKKKILFFSPEEVTVVRGDSLVKISMPDSLSMMLGSKEKIKKFDFSLLVPYNVENVTSGSYADVIGIKKGDYLINIGDKDVSFFKDLRKALDEYKTRETTLKLVRNGDTLTKIITVPKNGKLGFSIHYLMEDLNVEKLKHSFFESVQLGYLETYNFIRIQIVGLGLLFKPEVKVIDSVGGFISIGNIFPDQWDWLRFWKLTAMLSAMIGFLNLLPIPALDGGHLVITFIEAIIRRPLGLKTMNVIQIIGVSFLILLVLIVNLNEVYKFIILPLLG